MTQPLDDLGLPTRGSSPGEGLATSQARLELLEALSVDPDLSPDGRRVVQNLLRAQAAVVAARTRILNQRSAHADDPRPMRDEGSQATSGNRPTWPRRSSSQRTQAALKRVGAVFEIAFGLFVAFSAAYATGHLVNVALLWWGIPPTSGIGGIASVVVGTAALLYIDRRGRT